MTREREGGACPGRAMTERVFFVVDRTKLKEETDEFRNAIVVYMPKSDLKKVQGPFGCRTGVIELFCNKQDQEILGRVRSGHLDGELALLV